MLTTLPLASGLLLSDFHPTTTNIRDLRREIRAAADRCAIAETTGAGMFRAIPLVRNYHEAARRTPSAEATLLDGWNVTLSSHFRQLTPAAIQAMLPWGQIEKTGQITTLRAFDIGLDAPVIQKLSWFGETSRGLALIDLYDAIATGGLTLTFLPGDGGAAPFELRAHCQSTDAPFAIHLLDA